MQRRREGRFRSTRRETLKLDYKNKMKNKNLTILKGEKDKYRNFYFFIFFPPARPEVSFMKSNFSKNGYKLKNSCPENMAKLPKTKKFAAFFQPNSWHEKVLNI